MLKKKTESEDMTRNLWLKNNIIKLYGERCPDFCQGCPVCEVWCFYDTIVNEGNET